MPPGPPPNSGPTGPRLASQPLSSTTHAHVSARSPRPSPRLARNDSTVSSPSDLQHFTTPARATTFDVGSNSRRQPPSSTIGGTIRTDSLPRSKSSSNTNSGSSSPMFFHASDVRSQRSTPVKQASRPPASSARFFHVSETRSGVASRSHSPTNVIVSPPGTNSTPTPMPKLASLPTPPLSTASKQPHVKVMRPEEHASALRRRDRSPDTRPISPYDSSGGSSASTRLMASPLASTSPPKPSYLNHQQVPPHSQPASQRNSYVQPPPRRQSVDLTPRRHGRASSVSGEGMNGFDHHDLRQSPKSPTVPLHVLSNAAAIIEQQKELAAAARREGKILDLEITNASLLAINKTFEKRIKKQTTEIRRFKRLSRAGLLNLSAAKSAKRRSKDVDHPSASDDEWASAEEGEELPDEDDEEESSEEESEESPEDGSNKTKDPKPQSEKSLARDAATQKRLVDDLARHRALLDASAKMNASLKRCSFLTETLIEEAKKSLAYIVRPSEVKIAPRVVDQTDDEGDDVAESEIDTEFDDHQHFQDDSTTTGDTDGYSTPTYQESDLGSRSESRSDVVSSIDGDYDDDDDDGSSGSISGGDGSEVSSYGIEVPDIMTPRVEGMKVLA